MIKSLEYDTFAIDIISSSIQDRPHRVAQIHSSLMHCLDHYFIKKDNLTLLHMARIYRRCSDFSAAKSYLEKHKAEHDTSSAYLYELVQLYLATDRPELAHPILIKLQNDPELMHAATKILDNLAHN